MVGEEFLFLHTLHPQSKEQASLCVRSPCVFSGCSSLLVLGFPLWGLGTPEWMSLPHRTSIKAELLASVLAAARPWVKGCPVTFTVGKQWKCQIGISSSDPVSCPQGIWRRPWEDSPHSLLSHWANACVGHVLWMDSLVKLDTSLGLRICWPCKISVRQADQELLSVVLFHKGDTRRHQEPPAAPTQSQHNEG